MPQLSRSITVEGGSYRNKATGAEVIATRWNKDGDHPQVARYPIEGRDYKGILVVSDKEKYALTYGDWIIETGENVYIVADARFAADFEEITVAQEQTA